MEAIVLILGAFGASGVLWSWQQRRDQAARKKAITTMLDEGMQVALHLAKHAAASRQQPFSALHVLYAILQDDAITAKLEALGGDRAAIDAALDRALETLDPTTDPRDGNRLLGTALGMAKSHGRSMTVVDALVAVARTPHAAVLDAPPVSRDALVFALVHGSVPPDTLPRETHVHVVIRNDDFTTQQLVVEVLRDVFELPEAEAFAKMRATHESGKAVVGRFPVAIAQQKIIAARSRARAELAPLWIGVEVC